MLGAIVAAAMAASFFMTWVSLPFGEDLIPAMIFDHDFSWADMPWQFYAFMVSFALSALSVVLVLFRRPAGLFMLLAGGLPLGVIAHATLSARKEFRELGLPLPGGGSPEFVLKNPEVFREVIGLGLPVYFGAAALLVLIGSARLVRGT